MSLRAHARLRLWRDDDIAFGPGKADLLEAIRATGSISAAAKSLDMSYRRAWLLVDTMNACFEEPLVNSSKGGSGGGGAEVTAEGLQVLERYRVLQQEVDKVLAGHLPWFEGRASKPRRRAR